MRGRLDPDQELAVRMRRNGTVSAGAGSGKTTVLTARYLDLIESGEAEIGEILALTFTRKAAAEMHFRIHKAMSESEAPRIVARRADFSEAVVSTIDSFCATLVRGAATEFGYPPDFTTDDEGIADLAEERALSYLLETRESPPIAELLARLGFAIAWKEVFAKIALRYVLPYADPGSDFTAMAKRYREALRRILDEETASLIGIAGEALVAGAEIRAPKADCAAALDLFRRVATGMRSAQGGRGGDTDPGHDDTDSFEPVLARAQGLRLVSYSRSDPGELAVKECARQARTLAASLSGTSAALGDSGLVDGIMHHLDAFASEFREAKRRAGIMGFHDVTACAIRLLTMRRDLRSLWKSRFRYIMIDEFQDNNAEQRDLLYLLAERSDRLSPGIPAPGDLVPDKLFFVGDEKQSIYLFRGADVSVFRSLDTELDPGSGASRVRLGRNYRSEPGLVDFFNSAFGRILGDAREDFEARFEKIEARQPGPGRSPTIRYLLRGPGTDDAPGARPPAGEDPERNADESVAYAVARFIRNRIDGRDLPVSRGSPEGTRPATAEDFAILLRSTTKQYLLERCLRRFGIPYSASSAGGLFVESPVNDLYSALRLVALPGDRAAYAAVLRSPLVGVSDDAFVSILFQRDRAAFDPELARGLAAADAERYLRAAGLFARFSAAADGAPLAGLVWDIWNAGGLRLALVSRPDAHPYLEHFEYVFARAADADRKGRNLVSFVVDELAPSMGSVDRQDVDDLQKDHAGGVRIMTVHKSKGLEFPVVVLPFMNTKGKEAGLGDAWYHDPDVGVCLDLPRIEPGAGRYRNVFFDRARKLNMSKRIAETKRLFYVACTRAIDHLVFAGSEPERAENETLSFHALLAGGDGRPGPDGRFPSMEPCVLIEPVPPLRESEYRRAFSGGATREIDSMIPGYRSARILDRARPGRVFAVSEIAVMAERLRAGAAEDGRRTGEEAGSGASPESPEGPSPAGSGAGTDAAAAGARDSPAADTPQATGRRFAPLKHELVAGTPEDRRERAAAFGSLCHAIIEAELKGLPGDSLLPREIAAHCSATVYASMLADAKELAGAFLESRERRSIPAGADIMPERSFLLALPGDAIAKGRIDLLVRSGDEVRVYDFKTDASFVARRHAVQVGLYRRAAALMHPGCTVRAFVVLLRDMTTIPCDDGPEDGELAECVRLLRMEEQHGST